MLKDQSDSQLLAEWVKLIGKICINPAIQKKLMDLNIHESITNICISATDENVWSSAALSLGAIAINNPKMVEWLLAKNVQEVLLKRKPKGTEAAADLCQFIYSITFNNDPAKQVVQQLQGLAFLVRIYR